MRNALVIQHVAFEDPGTLVPVLRAAGFHIETLYAGVDDLGAIDAVAPDFLIVLGGPVGVYDTEEYPWLLDEISLLSKRLAAQRPTLGICLGAQLIAAATGARVKPGMHGKEIGWSRLFPVPGAQHLHLLHALFGDSLRVLHWHGDTFDLPTGAVHLASSDQYAHQAFVIGNYALALQFHAEVRLAALESWYIGHAAELAQAHISVSQLRVDGRIYAPALENAAQPLWQGCLNFLFPNERP